MPRSQSLTPGEFARLGPGRFLADALRAQMARLDSALTRRAADAADADAIHDVRVSTRRLTGILDAARDWLPAKRARRVRRGLKRLRSALGGAREADVGAGLLRERQATLPADERFAAAALAASLVRGRRDDPGGAPPAGPKRIGRLLARLQRLVAGLDGGPDGGEDFAAFRAHALRELHARRDALLSRPRAPLDALDDEAQHRFRIGVKKLRYGLELFAPIFPPKIEARIRLLRETQDQLGAMHDLADLARAATELGDAAARAEMPEASAFHRLAAALDAWRRDRYDGFAARYDALAHPGFLPPLPAPAEAAPEAGPAAAPPPATRTADPQPDTAPPPAPPPLRIVGGDDTEST
jgi:CHAD domain-containing protein